VKLRNSRERFASFVCVRNLGRRLLPHRFRLVYFFFIVAVDFARLASMTLHREISSREEDRRDGPRFRARHRRRL
jgi:hypothetical protein